MASDREHLVRGSRDSWWWQQTESMHQSQDPEDWVPEPVVPLIEGGVRSELVSYEEAVEVGTGPRTFPDGMKPPD
jgi:hypothetical protein